MRKPPHLRSDDDDEGDTYHSLSLNDIEDVGQGRFAKPKPFNIGEKGNQYPPVAPTPLTSQQPDHSFMKDRDRIDPSDTCGMTFNQDLFGGAKAAPDGSDNSHQAPEEEARPKPQLPPPFIRRS